MSLPGSDQSYSNLSSWRTARYQNYIASAEARLTAVQAQLLELTASPVESYNFNAADGGSQSATYRKIKELGDEEDRLIGMINKYNGLLYGGGVVQINMRRK